MQMKIKKEKKEGRKNKWDAKGEGRRSKYKEEEGRIKEKEEKEIKNN